MNHSDKLLIEQFIDRLAALTAFKDTIPNTYMLDIQEALQYLKEKRTMTDEQFKREHQDNWLISKTGQTFGKSFSAFFTHPNLGLMLEGITCAKQLAYRTTYSTFQPYAENKKEHKLAGMYYTGLWWGQEEEGLARLDIALDWLNTIINSKQV